MLFEPSTLTSVADPHHLVVASGDGSKAQEPVGRRWRCWRPRSPAHTWSTVPVSGDGDELVGDERRRPTIPLPHRNSISWCRPHRDVAVLVDRDPRPLSRRLSPPEHPATAATASATALAEPPPGTASVSRLPPCPSNSHLRDEIPCEAEKFAAAGSQPIPLLHSAEFAFCSLISSLSRAASLNCRSAAAWASAR